MNVPMDSGGREFHVSVTLTEKKNFSDIQFYLRYIKLKSVTSEESHVVDDVCC